MIKYISQFQTKIKEFGNLHQMKLNPNNRWIQMAQYLPWDELVKIFSKYFSSAGCPSINPRIVIGSLIIKHKMNLDDRSTVQIIEENPYMQFFLGLDEFAPEPLFTASLFSEWRDKLGHETFNDFTDVLLKICFSSKMNTTNNEVASCSTTSSIENKGKLKLDATVADQYISYPTDLGLLNQAREKTENLIDKLYEHCRRSLKIKPRTYRKVARQRYLVESKKRQKNKKSLRKCIRYQLNCLDRNVKSINKMLDLLEINPLSHRQMRTFWIVQTLNNQQRYMYDNRINRCDDRIVSLSQPQVRPILRGKAGKKVEFGAKLGLAMMDGFVKVETLKWDNYNECADLIPHVEAYKELYGYYPELVQVDKIYGTNANRKYCKDRQIRMTVIPKGKSKEMTNEEKKQSRKEFNERNHIEGKIGQAKQAYNLNQIKAKKESTSKTWIALTLFMTNLVKFAEYCDFNF